MSHLDTWVVPAPLTDGQGWKIWYSRPGTDPFEPAVPAVFHNGQPHPVKEATWTCLPAPSGLRRRMGIRELRIATPCPTMTYEVRIPETPLRSYRWKTFPTSVGTDGVSFLLGSCYWLPNDKEGAYRAGVLDLGKTELPTPSFKLLIGDQVYQDWPPNFSIDDPASRFAQRYDQYWGEPVYQEVLTASPNLFTCDDHEFWNAFPEAAPLVATTWTEAWRKKNTGPARELFWLYQTVLNPTGKAWFSFTIDPVSFFVTDSRSERDPIRKDDPHFFGEEQWNELEAWAANLRGPGVLVLGQPFFAHEKGFVKKRLDPSIQNFKRDFGRLSRVFANAIRGGSRGVEQSHDIVILSGDIHRARHFRGTLRGMPRSADVHELVSSAASRIRMGIEVKGPKPDKALKLYAGEGVDQSVWIAEPIRCDPPWKLPTADNNVAVIRMSPGPQAVDTGAPQVRFTMAVYSLRTFTPAWTRLTPWSRPKGKQGKVYQTEIDLR